MHIHTRNVNTAFRDLVQAFHDGERGRTEYHNPIVKRPSRNGNVLMIDEPVTITYTHPRERVLFNAARDANPYFFMYEAMWMLAGRNDVAPLAFYAKQMKEYSDDGETLNGAYGYRWRHADTSVEERDQLDILVEHLGDNPSSRRAVLTMWNAEDDLMNIAESKDVACNLNVMFSIREGSTPAGTDGWDTGALAPKQLDMTVTNRSNDMIWGALGANYVHFTFLQEYMAARLGVEVGVYNHFSNNMHVYEWNWKPQDWLSEVNELDFYENYWGSIPLVENPEQFEKEVVLFAEQAHNLRPIDVTWEEPFFAHVTVPAAMAFAHHKNGNTAKAIQTASYILADDWRLAGVGWLQRRLERGSK